MQTDLLRGGDEGRGVARTVVFFGGRSGGTCPSALVQMKCAVTPERGQCRDGIALESSVEVSEACGGDSKVHFRGMDGWISFIVGFEGPVLGKNKLAATIQGVRPKSNGYSFPLLDHRMQVCASHGIL